MEHVCTFCRLFIPVVYITLLQQGNNIFSKSFRSHISIDEGHNSYEQSSDHLIFCQSYINNIFKFKSLRLNSVNKINMDTCYSNLAMLQVFILVEKTIFAYAHPIITIIKLHLMVQVFLQLIHGRVDI